MIEFRRILCPIDFSDYSRHALTHAGAIARWYDAAITVLHVSPVVPIAAYAPGTPMHQSILLTPTERDAILEEMRRFAEDEIRGDAPIRFEIVEGHAAADILARSSSADCDLIVMGTHGRSGFERLVLGSVAEKVLRKAHCPVLTVPPRAGGPVPSEVFTRILCATDFSDCSIRALTYAMSLAQEADARLTVLHVIELPMELSAETNETVRGGLRTFWEYVAGAERERGERLAALVPDSVRSACTVETVIAKGTPYREILRSAEAQRSDLIVMGIHGRGAADLLFFGSTTQHVVRQAACPVLTLRTH